MKKFLLAAVLVFIIAGAFCMSYSTEWIFDVIGAVLLAGAFVFSGSILLAILGAGMFAVYGFLIRRE